MSDYPRSAGDTLTDEEMQYYRSNSPDAIQLREDMCKYLKICLTTLGAAAVAATIANYSTKGGTRKRITSRRGGVYKKRTMRKRMRKHTTRRQRR
jgi:hypothetical protein